MSIIVSNSEQISKSPTNTSTAKQLFSFPKANRFSNGSRNISEVIGYDLPSTRSSRYWSFGIGNRFPFKIKNDAPPPGSYEPQTMFAKNPKGKAFSFGISRLSYEKVYNEKDKQPDKNIPGPGTYRIEGLWGKEGRFITLKSKLSSNLLRHSKYIPGPGAYEPTVATSKWGNYFNSKFRSSKAAWFSPARSERFKLYPRSNSQSMIPGPGMYEPKNSICKDGNYFLSNYKSTMWRTFYHHNRDTIPVTKQKKTMPGPGTYRIPSEFGHYESKHAHKEFQIRRQKRRARSVEDERK